jgi:UDP-glucose 4-epimerase
MINYFIVGGAGFIGSHLANTIIAQDENTGVIIYDNFSSGRRWHFDEIKNNSRFGIIDGDAKDGDLLTRSMDGTDVVYHFASNPDIAKAVTEPDIDFREGTYLTNNVLEAVRVNGVKKLFYSSGSGVYGDTGYLEVDEDYSPMLPISTYGASKLACEALICSYCHMFEINAAVFRFANVVGPHQTHGVGYDFIRKLLKNPDELSIMGDGTQSKSYIHVSDVIRAMRLVERKAPKGFSCYNVATTDYLAVSEIADIAVDVLGLKDVKYSYTGGSRGWKGDVPIVRLNSKRIRDYTGWENLLTSREAIYKSLRSIYEDVRKRGPI